MSQPANDFAAQLADSLVACSLVGRQLTCEVFGSDAACVYCGVFPPRGRRLTFDHIVPQARSGSDRAWNLVNACRDCNRRKNARPVEAFASPEVVARIEAYQTAMRDLVERAHAEAEPLGRPLLPPDVAAGPNAKVRAILLGLPSEPPRSALPSSR